MKLILPLSLISLLALSSCETTQMDVSTGNARVTYAHRGGSVTPPPPAKPVPASPVASARQNQPDLPAPQPPVKATPVTKPAPATPPPHPKVNPAPRPSAPAVSPTRQNQPEMTPPPAPKSEPTPPYSGRYATIHTASGRTTQPTQKSTRKRVLMPGQNRGLKSR